MLEWRELEHELNDNVSMDHPPPLDALRNYGLLKFIFCQSIRAQPAMLHTLVNMWDLGRKHFFVRNQVVTPEMEDIYFLTGFSRRGVTVVLVGGKRGGAE
jgi:hypothetical protein